MNSNTVKLLQKHFDTALETPDGIKKLRELILTLAMQGKLVPQNPKDQPASELLKEIEAEKKRLVKEGKIKKQEPLPPIKAEEAPYELPKGWEWVNLQDLFALVTDGDHQAPPKAESGIPFLVIGNLNRGKISLVGCRFVPHGYYQSLDWGRKPLKNDLLYTVTGSYGIPIRVDVDDEFCVQRHVAIFKSVKSSPIEYLHCLMNSAYVFKYATSVATGIAQKTVPLTGLRKMPVPIPPVNEQRRIVAKIAALMALCDRLEAERNERNQKRLTVHTAAMNRLLTAQDKESFSASWSFITKNFSELYSIPQNVAELKKAILQLAVMGKLGAQDPKDQPASELLKEIETEKKRLVKAGKIKEQKPLPEIKSGEAPYELPTGWEWVRFFNINQVKSELVNSKDYPEMLQIAPDSIEKGNGKLLFNRTVTEAGVTGPNNKFYKGQLLYSKIRPSLSKAIIAPYDGLCSADMYPMVTFVDPIFMLKVILSETFLAQVRVAENRVKMPKLNLESLGVFVVPLPPLAEQCRIVAKIDKLMSFCDDLEKQIAAATDKQTAIFNAVLAQV